MESKSRGVVLQSVKYGDNSLIVNIYTQDSGLQSFYVKGVFNHSNALRPALFQCMNIINYVVSGRANDGKINYLKEVSIAQSFKSIPTNMQKNAVVFFMGDILSSTILEHEQNEVLFSFIENSLLWLDFVDEAYVNFPIYFILELSRFLGFYPKADDYQPQAVFDLCEGIFRKNYPDHPYYFDSETSLLLKTFCDTKLAELAQINIRNKQRRTLLDGLLNYYKIHIPTMREIKSHEILKIVLE